MRLEEEVVDARAVAHGCRGLTLAAALVVVLALPGLAQAAPKSFVANRGGDHIPNGCTRSECTLREAVIAANNHGGRDKVVLRAKTYTLALPSTSEDEAVDGDLDIKGPVTIAGKGPRKTVVDGGGAVVHDVAFDVFPGGRVAISGLSERNSTGDAHAGIFVEQNARLEMAAAKVIDNDASCCDAGIFTDTGSELTLRRVRVANNTGPSCCNGIYTGSGTSLTLSRVVVSGNSGNCCNGVYVGGKVTATQTTIRGNHGDSCCQGLYTGDGRVVLNKVKVLHNHDSTGGFNGLYLGDGNAFMKDIKVLRNTGGPTSNGCCNGLAMGAGDLTLRRGVISDNSGGGCCNGIEGDEGKATLRDVVVSRNSGATCCQGIENYDSPMTLIRATVSENIDSSSCCTGIQADAGTMTLRNVTVSGNSAATLGGGITSGGPISLNNVTVTNNRVLASDGDGGGIFVGAGEVEIRNSIVAGNSVGGAGTGPDCFGTLSSEGHNLIGDTAGCTIDPGGGNLLDVAPLLAPLRNNGGFTPTHALRLHSPAIDKGSPQAPGSSAEACEKRDQRGVKRPQGNRCDIGAFERKR